MKRKSLVALIASLAVFGVVLTGCSSSTEAPVEEVVQEAEEAVDMEAEEADNEIADLAQAIEDERLQKASALEAAFFDFFEAKNEKLGREVSEGLYYCYVDINLDFIREICYINLEEKKCYLVYTVPNEDGSYTAKEQYICDAHGDNIFHNTFKEKAVFTYYPCSGAIHTASRDLDIKDAITRLTNKENSYFNYLVFKYNGVDVQKICADVEYRNEELDEMSVSITTNLTDYFESGLSEQYNCRMRLDGNEDSWIDLDDTNFDKFVQLMNEWYINSGASREVSGSMFEYEADAFMEIAYDFNRNNMPVLY